MKRIELKVNHINPGDKSYLTSYLTSLGIKIQDVNSFLAAPRFSDVDNPHKLLNLDYAVETAYQLLNGGANVYVQPDSDTDGFTSSAILISYIKRRWPTVRINYELHNGKEHGINCDYIKTDDKLIFIPDAGSNDYEQQKELIAANKTVIILDHHEVNENYEETGAILVNNQFSPEFFNKNLSGVGIVYMFLRAMDEKHFADSPIADDYLDLTAVGIIADAMNMTTLGNNWIAYNGLNNIKNKFLKELAEKQERGIKDAAHLSKIDVAFYIAPVINGVIRSGTAEDKNLVFRALWEENCTENFLHEWRGVKNYETLYQHAVRLAVNAKSRQDSAKKKSFEWLCDEIRKNGWDQHNIVIATINEEDSKKVNQNVTGLIAMELVKEFGKPCLVLRTTEYEGQMVYGGSGRNGNFYGIPSLLDFLKQSGLVLYAAGHANAHGLFITKENVDALRAYSDKMLNAESFNDTVFEVDYWFHSSDFIDQGMLYEFAQQDKLWGNGLPRPLFAFDFNYSPSNVQIMGKDKSSVKIKYDGIDFVTFKDAALVKLLQTYTSGHITIVGAPSLNEFMGRSSIQIVMDDYVVEPLLSTQIVRSNNLGDLI